MNLPPNDPFSSPSENQFQATEDFATSWRKAPSNLKRLFISLLLVGVTTGGLVSIAVVKVINKLGLNQKPEQTERIQR
jgi:hypothetical protein